MNTKNSIKSLNEKIDNFHEKFNPHGLPQGEVILRSKDMVDIKFDYCTGTGPINCDKSNYVPDDSKWTTLKMISQSKLTIRGKELKPEDKVTAVIINKSDSPENIPYSQNKVILSHPEWNEKEKAFIDQKTAFFGHKDAMFISTRGYGGSVNYDQEIAIQVNDRWLVDPVSKTHNFKFDLD
jgi:hypothetical protein